MTNLLSALVLASALLLSACGSPLNRIPSDAPAYYLIPVGKPTALDGRTRFREIFCQLMRATPPGGALRLPCDAYLWRLSGEVAPTRPAALLPTHRPALRLIIVRAAFSECFGDSALPFAEGVAKLQSLGYPIDVLMVSGRSSSAHNAQQIAESLDRLTLNPDEKLVLMGYSKGVPDILEFLDLSPVWAKRIDAVVSVSGVINGTPLADHYAKLYDRFFAKRDAMKACPPGDGGVVDSLTHERRLNWIATHALPGNIRYFSVASYTTRRNVARALAFTWDELAKIDVRNDGQVLAQDQILPGSMVLGYVNADHWSVAIHVEKELPFLAGRSADVAPFPQSQLLEAMVLYLNEALDGVSVTGDCSTP